MDMAQDAVQKELKMEHDGRDISFDPLEATHGLARFEESTTSRVSNLKVDLQWRDLVFDVPIPKSKKKLETVETPETAKFHTYPDPSEEIYPRDQGMRRILHGISGQVRSGQVLAIMGASGSGKTTLLNMLSGRLKSSNKCRTAGEVLVNGQRRQYESFVHIAKFVEQDDTTMFANLTVREQILFAARLALPSSMSEAQIAARADKIIQELGLAKSADTFIGNAIVRGVSGGERRRCAIGIELVTDPSLIFLDEPTTGLDSFNSLNVMTSLRQLARNGRSIITTIHQPRSSIFHLFDKLCLISEGKVVFFGDASDTVRYFSRIGFASPSNFNVADYAIDVLSIDYRSPEKEKKSRARSQYLSERYRNEAERAVLAKDETYDSSHYQVQISNEMREPHDPWSEFLLLARRTGTLLSREKGLNRVRLVKAVLLGILLGLIWLDTGREDDRDGREAVFGILFFITLNQTFDAAYSVSFQFPSERKIISREQSSGFYRDSSYIFGRIIWEIPTAAVIQLILLLIVYFMIGLRDTAGAFFTLLLILTLSALAGEALSQTISVFAGKEQVAAALVPMFIISQIMLGGFFIRPNALPDHIQWLRWFSFVYYAFNAITLNEFVGGPLDEEIIEPQSSDFSKWENILVVFAYYLMLKLIYCISIQVKKPKFDRGV